MAGSQAVLAQIFERAFDLEPKRVGAARVQAQVAMRCALATENTTPSSRGCAGLAIVLEDPRVTRDRARERPLDIANTRER